MKRVVPGIRAYYVVVENEDERGHDKWMVFKPCGGLTKLTFMAGNHQLI
jgi:hypothetical protein